jgi:hypothetical protein
MTSINYDFFAAVQLTLFYGLGHHNMPLKRPERSKPVLASQLSKMLLVLGPYVAPD